jgi:hypothetical protein
MQSSKDVRHLHTLVEKGTPMTSLNWMSKELLYRAMNHPVKSYPSGRRPAKKSAHLSENLFQIKSLTIVPDYLMHNLSFLKRLSLSQLKVQMKTA